MSSVSLALSNTGFALVDQDDLRMLEGRTWAQVACGKKRYACTQIGKKRIYMHRFLLGVHEQSLPWVDHRNGDGLDNTRDNMRLASPALNSYNRQSHGEYRGVFQQSGGYMARVAKEYGGLYERAVLAALAADDIAMRTFGSDARLNFPADLGTATLSSRFLTTI